MKNERGVQDEGRLRGSENGVLSRNNVGAFIAPNGALVRYGLANESKKVNQNVKSSDLIGLRQVIITLAHVGQPIAQFVALECKPSDWVFTGTKREIGQRNYHDIINGHGGYARFYTGGEIYI